MVHLGTRLERIILPTPPTPLIGREQEIEAVRDLLARPEVREVTLTGTGGTGKTRLALAIGETLAESAPGGVCFADLTRIGSADSVPSAIAQALGVQESGSGSTLDVVRGFLAERDALLILDNFEHVLPASPVVGELLAACSRLKVVATSREPLNLRAEHVFPVPALALPDPESLPSLADVEEFAAISLFVDRAQARDPGFALRPDNVTAVAELCVRLDGLPLAIEIAAAQLNVFSVQGILNRLKKGAPLVVGGAADLPTRHQTLDSVVAWSYGFLSLSEQAVLRLASVFAGDFTPMELEAVHGMDLVGGEALSTLASLANKSLVQVTDRTGDEPRFRLLETIRAFALSALAAENGLAQALERHANYFTCLAEQTEPSLVGPTLKPSLEELDRQFGNFRAVFQWSVASEQLDMGLRLIAALHRFWMLRGHLTEARQWLNDVLPRSGRASAEIRAKAFNTAGVLAGIQDDSREARTLFEQSVALWRDLGDQDHMAAVLSNLGLVAQNLGEMDAAMVYYREAEAIYRENGNNRGLAMTVGSQARVARQLADYPRAETLFNESRGLFDQVGDVWGVANSLANLGYVALALDNLEGSFAYFSEVLQRRRDLGNLLGIAECLEGFAATASRGGQDARAIRLYGAAEALRETTGAALLPGERVEHDAAINRSRRRLTPRGYTSARVQGRAFSADEAVDYALSGEFGAPIALATHARELSAFPLTRREQEIAALLADGLTNRQIANKLVVTEKTVEKHLEHIFAKLNADTRSQVAVWATRRNLSA